MVRRFPGLGFLVAMLVAVGAWGSEKRPNILYIMTDDHATHAIGAYGGHLASLDPTPNLDKLAKQGMRFERVYATNSICTPSRAAILTGQYSHINGVPVFNTIDPNRPVVSRHLQKAGYYTGMIGKWHLGTDPQGFDIWEILPGQGAYNEPMLYSSKGDKKYEGHATDVITDLAIGYLENRPKDKPFFFMVHHKAPHRTWIPHPRHAAIYKDKTIPEPPTLFDKYEGRTDAIKEQKQSIARDLNDKDVKLAPPAGLEGDALTRWKYQRYMQDYLACVKGVDDSVGKLMEWLEKNGLADNTVVIYTSDQGFFLGDHGMYDKRFMYEESARMPFIVRWPGKVKPGSTSDALGINCDFAPTFLDLAGEKTPTEMQGRSLLPLLAGNRPADWRTSFYYRYYHDPGHHNTAAHYGVRTATHKLIHFNKKNQWECYDLVKDPEELKNIYSDPAAQGVVSSLKAELMRLKKELGDTDQFASSEDWPKTSPDAPRGGGKKGKKKQ